MTVISEAYVDVLPNVDPFQRDLENGISEALRRAVDRVDSSMRDIEQIFDRTARSASQAFDNFEPDFSSATEEARDTERDIGRITGNIADEMERDFEEGVRGATEDIEDLADAFDDIDNAASAAAGDVSREFEVHGERAEDAIGEVGRRGEREFDRIEREARDAARVMVGHFRGIGAGLAAGFAAIGVARFVGDAIEATADLGESINAVNVVLEDGAESFLEFGQDSADALGITQAALNESIVPMASLLRNAGSGGDELSGQLEELSIRATDVGSVFNRDVNEVLDAFGAALRGETEPIRAFGVQINQAAIDAKALELGLVGADGAVDQAAKTQAAFALIMEQTSVAAGDFAATADSLPNLMRRFDASLTETQTTLGEGILPALTEIGQSGLEELETLSPAFDVLGDSVGDALLELEPFVAVLADRLADTITTVAPSLPSLAEGFGAVLEVAGALGPVVAELAESVLPLVADVAVSVSDALVPIVDTLAELLSTLPNDVVALSVAFFALGRSVGIANRSLGIIGIALTGLATAMSFFGDSTEEAESGVNEFELSMERLRRGQIDDTTQEIADLYQAFLDMSDQSILDNIKTTFSSLGNFLGMGKSDSEEAAEAFEDFSRSLEPVDQELASLVSGGRLGEARDLFDGLQEALGITDEEMERIANEALPEYTAAQELAEQQTGLTTEALEEMNTATAEVGTALSDFTTDSTAMGFVNLAQAIQDSSDVSGDMAAVADELGVSVSSLEAIVPGVAAEFETMSQDIQNAMPGVGDAITAAFERAQEAERDLNFGDLRAGIDETLESAQQFQEDLQTILDAGLTNLFDVAVQGGPEVASALVDGIGSEENVTELERNVGKLNEIMQEQTLQMAADAAVVSFFVGQALETGTLDGISALPENLQSAIQTALDGVLDVDAETTPGTVGGNARKALRGGFTPIVQDIFDTANTGIPNAMLLGADPAATAGREYGNKARSATETAVDGIQPFVNTMYSTNIPESIRQSAGVVAGAGASYGNRAERSTESGVGGVDNFMRTMFQTNIPSGIRSGSDNAGRAGSSVGSAAGGGVRSGISSQEDSVDRTARSLVNSAISSADGATGGAVGVGVGITGGIASGMNSSRAINNIISVALAVVRTAIAAAKVAAGISSPSRVAAREIGAPFSEGIAVGISDSEPLVLRAISSLVQRATDAMPDTIDLPEVRVPEPDTGFDAAVREIMDRIQSGGSFFEDFTFRGGSENLGRFNDDIVDAFKEYARGTGFNFGERGSRNALVEFLQSLLNQQSSRNLGSSSAAVRSDPQILELRLDLGRGIQEVVRLDVNDILNERNRTITRRVTSGTGGAR